MAGIIIALLIGSGAGYIYGQSPIAGYQENIDRLEAENLGIREKKAQLLEEYTNLQDQLTEVKKDLSSTRSSLEDLQAQIEERDERINDLKLLNEEKDLQISSLLSQIEGLELRLEGIFSGIELVSFSIPSGVYHTPLSVNLSSSLDGGLVYYTTDGSEPSVYSDIYSGPIKIVRAGTTTIKAVVLKEELSSSISSASYTIDYGDMPLGEIGGLHYVYWDFGRDNFQSFNITIRIYDEPSFQDGLYFQMYQGFINDVGFYFGIQTDVYRPNVGSTGKGLIFSRWETRDLSNAKPVDDGWTQSAGYEGDFIGIRKNYEWTTHTYRLKIAKVDTDDIGDWYGVWINDLDTGDVDYLGSIRFPRVESGRSGIKNHGISWTELYYKKDQQTPIPSWHVSIKEITVDEGKPPLHATSDYSSIQNTDIYYEEVEEEIHFLMGYDVEREHSARLLY